MKVAFLVVVAILASILMIGCQGKAETEEYGGPVKDSGGKAIPPGKGGAALPNSIDQ